MVATDQIIKELCLEMGDPQFLNYSRLLGGVLDGIRDLSLFNMPSYSHAVLDINHYNAVDWPCGLVKPLMTCLLREGRCVVLAVDDNIVNSYNDHNVKVVTPESEHQIKDMFNIDGAYFSWYGNFNWGLGEIYGLTSMIVNGYVSHNKNLRQSTIKGNCTHSSDQVVIFYITDGLDDCPMFVPTECKTAIEHYALYKFFRTRDPNLSERNLRNYKENFTRLNKFWTGDDVTTWNIAMNSNVKSSPR